MPLNDNRRNKNKMFKKITTIAASNLRPANKLLLKAPSTHSTNGHEFYNFYSQLMELPPAASMSNCLFCLLFKNYLITFLICLQLLICTWSSPHHDCVDISSFLFFKATQNRKLD